MNDLSDDERNLLRHYYSEVERIVGGTDRSVAHQHLLRMGYIEERAVNLQELLIVVTDAGRRAAG
jgi:hypothetical protein